MALKKPLNNAMTTIRPREMGVMQLATMKFAIFAMHSHSNCQSARLNVAMANMMKETLLLATRPIQKSVMMGIAFQGMAAVIYAKSKTTSLSV